jgi:hypothetical protein
MKIQSCLVATGVLLGRCLQEESMTIERYLRLIAGTFVFASLVLGYWQSHFGFS